MATLNNDHKSPADLFDFTLIVDGRKYPAHKCLLSSTSRFFEKILCVEMKKLSSEEIIIEGISKEVFDIMLDFIYKGKAYVNNELLHSFKKVADYLGIRCFLLPHNDNNLLNFYTLVLLASDFEVRAQNVVD